MSGLPAKPTLRRITWCRVHHELLQQDLWALVADMARVELALVEAFVLRLEIYASAHTPRGSVEGFNIAALAAKWRRDKEELARLYATLEHPDVGWLDQDYVVTFWERNPDIEDPTAAERQQRRRDRMKANKDAAKTAREFRSPQGFPPSRVTARDSVTVTTRSDQNIKQERLAEEEFANPQGSPQAQAPAAIHSENGESGDRPIDPEVWLAFEGKRIVAERMQLLPSRAWLELNRWRKELGDDLDKLVSLIHDADSLGLQRGKFGDRMRSEIIRWRYEQKGPSLPLPPASVKDRRHG